MIDVKDTYKVSQVAEILGVSNDTVRFYDKMEILCPKKNRNTNYRSYTWQDLTSLDYVLRLKKIDLPLSRIKEVVNEDSLEQVLEVMYNQEAELEKRIEELTCARKLAKAYIRLFEEILKKEGSVVEEMSPVFIGRVLDDAVNEIVADFQKLSPLQVPCFTFVIKEELLEYFSKRDYEVYLEKVRNRAKHYISIVDDGTLSRSRLVTENEGLVIMPRRKCLHGIKKVSLGNENIDTGAFIEEAKRMGYRICGDLFARILSLSNDPENAYTFYDFWLPVEAAEK